MKSVLGYLLAVLSAAAYAMAYWVSVRPGASWIDGQWLFLVALPYNWATLKLFGESHFAPDAPAQLIAALLCDVVLSYVAGALVGIVAATVFRRARFKRQA